MQFRYVIYLFIFIFLHSTECQSLSFLPQSLIDILSDKTIQLKNIIKAKTRTWKDYCINNIKSKINDYFGLSNSSFRVPEENEVQFAAQTVEKQKRNSNKFECTEEMISKHLCIDDDPAIHMSTPQLIVHNGYPAESHTVQTDDGYLLTLHRIPHPKRVANSMIPRKTALLHHGLLGSSADWVLAGPEKSLAYILSDAGYDVWMANARGNTYSRFHVSKKIDSFAFWNFTWHDISQHDLPAVIDYIMETKGWDVKINYIGHSMGTTVLFALLSTQTQYNKILRAGFALAPVAYMSDVRSPIRLIAKYANDIEYIMKLFGANDFLPQNAIVKWLSAHACEINNFEEKICENSLFVLCGHDDKQFNKTLLPIVLGHVPAGASTKTVIHYAQEVKDQGRFQQYDYGPNGNMKAYGSYEPPEYPLHLITLPIALFSAQNDWLAGEKDVSKLYCELQNPIKHYIVPYKDFNHIDFILAIDAPKFVYKQLLHLLEEGMSAVFYDTIV